MKNSQEAAGKSLGASSSLTVRAEILEEVELKEPSNRSPFPYWRRTKTEQKAQAWRPHLSWTRRKSYGRSSWRKKTRTLLCPEENQSHSIRSIHSPTRSPSPSCLMLSMITWGYTNLKQCKLSHPIPLFNSLDIRTWFLVLSLALHPYTLYIFLDLPIFPSVSALSLFFPKPKGARVHRMFFGKDLTLPSADRWCLGLPGGWQCQASPTPQRASLRVTRPKARAPSSPTMAVMPAIGAWIPTNAHPVLAVCPAGEKVRAGSDTDSFMYWWNIHLFRTSMKFTTLGK